MPKPPFKTGPWVGASTMSLPYSTYKSDGALTQPGEYSVLRVIEDRTYSMSRVYGDWQPESRLANRKPPHNGMSFGSIRDKSLNMEDHQINGFRHVSKYKAPPEDTNDFRRTFGSADSKLGARGTSSLPKPGRLRPRPASAPWTSSSPPRPNDIATRVHKLRNTSTMLLPPHTLRSRQIAHAMYPQVYNPPRKKKTRKDMSPDEAAMVIQSSMRGAASRQALLKGM